MIPKASSGKSPLIAVVDDHEPFRNAICILLERHGYATCASPSVAHFIKSGAMKRIDCLILDVGLPEIDGISLHECLSHTNCTFPVIFCTGLEMDERLRNATQTGTVVVLRKPVASELLLETVRQACAGKIAGAPRP